MSSSSATTPSTGPAGPAGSAAATVPAGRSADDVLGPRDAAAAAPPRRLTQLGPLGSGLLLVAAAAVGSGGLAWGLAEVLRPVGSLAPALAAALGMLVLVLPMGVLMLKLARQLERSQDLLARLDTLDTLTGVSNRAHFLALADREWARARRYGNGTGVVLVEVDRFQRLVETRGRGAGDAVLRAVAAAVAPTLRGADALARFGPSQLAVLLGQADATGALDVAERVRERSEQLEVPWEDQRLRVTVSTGVATIRPAHLNLQAMLQDAEAALEVARLAGGNCVRAAPVDPPRQASRGPSVGDNQAAGPL